MELAELTDEDARRDGFISADKLRSELAALYAGQLAAGHRDYRVRFELLSSQEQAAALAQRKAIKSAQR